MRPKPLDDQGKVILSQEDLMTPEGKAALAAGIDLGKWKVAFKEQMLARDVADRLTQTSASSISVHWLVYNALQNWLRSEFSDHRRSIMSWPHGNWWVVTFRYYDPETQQVHREDVSLVMK